MSATLRRVARFVGYLVALVVVFFALQFTASESGEVVVVTAVDDAGTSHETRVWVVDLPDGTYLRAGSPDAEWLARVRAWPQVLLERGDERREVRLEAADKTPEVNAQMALKYGWADIVVGTVFSRRDAVALRVQPI